MSNLSEAKYSFLVEWLDTQACIVRQYHLFYYKLDGAIEMFDVRNRRTFLKRCKYPSVTLKDIYMGATVAVYSRQLKVIGYGDDFTQRELERGHAKAMAVIKPDGYRRIGEVLDAIHRARLSISNLKMVRLTEAQACDFYGDRALTDRSRALLGGPVTAIEVVGENAAAKVRHILHQVDGKGRPQSARDEPLSNTQGIMAASSQRNQQHEVDFFFKNSSLGSTAFFSECSVCVVKPHAVQAGHTGFVVSQLLDAGFEVSALQMFALSREASAEFLEVYQTVLPEFNALCEEMQSGPCVAMEVRKESNSVQALRELAGPSDPVIGKVIRPNTIRARLGQNKVLNAVHVTDLPEDGPLESEFFFSILQQQQ